jgi:hypothetical protein
MWKITEEIKNFVGKIEREKGPFDLFVMLKADIGEEFWEIYADAPWFSESGLENYMFLLMNIINNLPETEYLKIKKIIPVKNDNQIIPEFKNFTLDKTKKYFIKGYDQIEVLAFNSEKLFNHQHCKANSQ